MRATPAFDGIRGVAILAVLLYHGEVSWARGGFVGVDAFFVLSGFLITTLLLEEREATGRIALGRFWVRRGLRLLPALFLLLAGLGALEALEALRGREPGRWITGRQAVAVAAYFANWVKAFRAFPLGRVDHAWSLSIEEQYYLVWPLLLVAAFALRASPRRIGALALVLAGLSAVWRAWLYAKTGDSQRGYAGTDTRADVLLFGCALAAFSFRAPAPSPRAVRGVAVLGLLALVALAVTTVLARSDDPRWYRGGFTVAAAVGTVLVAAAAQGRGLVTAILSLAPLRALGRISYGVYLWHVPVMRKLQGAVPLPEPLPLILAAGLSIAIAWLSWRLVERPILAFRDRRAAPRPQAGSTRA